MSRNMNLDTGSWGRCPCRECQRDIATTTGRVSTVLLNPGIRPQLETSSTRNIPKAGKVRLAYGFRKQVQMLTGYAV